jgi:hypothetical protein
MKLKPAKKPTGTPYPQNVPSQVKFLLSTQIQNSPPLVPGAGSLRRRQNLNHSTFYSNSGSIIPPGGCVGVGVGGDERGWSEPFGDFGSTINRLISTW